jgi:hypothetical protein
VPSPNQRSLRANAIVIHNGLDTGIGEWTCNKDSTTNCAHITLARHMLQKLVTADLLARDEGVSVEAAADANGEVSH